MENCNDCTYSSVGQFGGVIRLYCGLCGRTLEGLAEGCERGKRLESLGRAGWQPWLPEGEALLRAGTARPR